MEIPRPEKILIAMYELGGGTTKALEYEDIVVKAWQLFPRDFGLRKYVNEYPDASDVHKPLYGPLKNRGFVLSGNKKFKLTEKGISYAQNLMTAEARSTVPPCSDRLSRDKEVELKRITETDAFTLYARGEKDKILDTDFYVYLGATVRTDRHEFLGRLNTVSDAVTEAARISADPKFLLCADLHRYLSDKFASIIKRKQGG